MEPEEIKDEDTLKTWLNARPEDTRQSDAFAIAQQCALRVFLLPGRGLRALLARKDDLTALPDLRILLTPGVVVKYPTPEVKKASTAARSADAATYVARVADATTYAARAAAADADSAHFDDVWEEVRKDAERLEADEDPVFEKLWSSHPPDWFLQADTKTRAIWAQDTALKRTFGDTKGWHSETRFPPAHGISGSAGGTESSPASNSTGSCKKPSP